MNECPRCGRLPGNSHTEACALQGEIERLRAELAEAKKFKDGMLDVLGGACPKDHRSTPFEEFKGCTPCLRAELAECRNATAEDALRYAFIRAKHAADDDCWYVCGVGEADGDILDAKIDEARKGEGE